MRTIVVPPPINGSNTKSPGLVKCFIAELANKGENLAG